MTIQLTVICGLISDVTARTVCVHTSHFSHSAYSQSHTYFLPLNQTGIQRLQTIQPHKKPISRFEFPIPVALSPLVPTNNLLLINMRRPRTNSQIPSPLCEAAFVIPAMAGTTRPNGRSRSASSTRRPPQDSRKERWCTMVPSSQPGFPAAEQMDLFLHHSLPKGGSSGGKMRGFRRGAEGKPRQADCYVEICPSGARDVVMHPGF